jgi:hypothetical protein
MIFGIKDLADLQQAIAQLRNSSVQAGGK